jgi:hypothetical protein
MHTAHSLLRHATGQRTIRCRLQRIRYRLKTLAVGWWLCSLRSRFNAGVQTRLPVQSRQEAIWESGAVVALCHAGNPGFADIVMVDRRTLKKGQVPVPRIPLRLTNQGIIRIDTCTTSPVPVLWRVSVHPAGSGMNFGSGSSDMQRLTREVPDSVRRAAVPNRGWQ